MRRFFRTGVALLLLSSLAVAREAADIPFGHRMIIAPVCLTSATAGPVKIIAKRGKMVLIEADENQILALQQAKIAGHAAESPCGGFRDVTQAWKISGKSPQAFLSLKTRMVSDRTRTISHPSEVNLLLASINPQGMWTHLTALTAFHDRYANSDSGVLAAEWLISELKSLTIGRKDVSVYTVPTDGYRQPSVILKIGESDSQGVVVSAHFDTVSGWTGWGRKHMPGADDDGSGTVTVLEAARVVLASGLHFKKPVYFMWYAAEEEGLVGSSSVTGQFRKQKVPIEIALHFDMTGYEYKNDPSLWLLSDYTSSQATSFLAALTETYVHQKVSYTKCGYACSDHASWTAAGVSAGAATEASFIHMNPSLHTPEDTMEKLSLRHMTDYLKLALAFVVESAIPVQG